MNHFGKPEEDGPVTSPEHKEVLTDSHPLKHLTFSIRAQTGIHELQLHLDIGQYTQKILWDHLIHNRVYEMGTMQVVSQILKPGDMFLDVGAHIGFFSLIASKWVGEHGKVIALEPEAANIDGFRRNIKINRIRNIDLRPMAIGAEEKEIDFYINSDNDGGHALWNVALHPQNEKSRGQQLIRKIPMTTLDLIIQDQTPLRPKLIKIDTEGAEGSVLQGAVISLSNLEIPYVICEINRFGLKQMESTEKELRDFMQKLGYDPYLISDQFPYLQKLAPDFFVNSIYVFNLLFSKNNPLETDSKNF
jgi:FkbM family methyltransferase